MYLEFFAKQEFGFPWFFATLEMQDFENIVGKGWDDLHFLQEQ